MSNGENPESVIESLCSQVANAFERAIEKLGESGGSVFPNGVSEICLKVAAGSARGELRVLGTSTQSHEFGFQGPGNLPALVFPMYTFVIDGGDVPPLIVLIDGKTSGPITLQTGKWEQHAVGGYLAPASPSYPLPQDMEDDEVWICIDRALSQIVPPLSYSVAGITDYEHCTSLQQGNWYVLNFGDHSATLGSPFLGRPTPG